MTNASDFAVSRPSSMDAAYRAAAFIWFGGAAAVLISMFVPGGGDGSMQLAGGLEGYFAGIVRRTYQVIRVAMPWIPVGMLLSWAMPVGLFRLVAILGLAICGLAAAIFGSGSSGSVLRDVLYVLPGLAAGAWIGRASLQTSWLQRLLDDAPSAPAYVEGEERTPRSSDQRAVPATAELGGLASSIAPGTQSSAGRVIDWSAGTALLVLAIWVLARFPSGGALIGIAMAVYAAVLWWKPLAWLVAVPAALPLLDLAPWTGRYFFDEFDVLIVVTVGVLMLRGPLAGRTRQRRRVVLLISLFLAATLVSLFAGLLPLVPADANAFSSYWSPYNALRVGKGILWGFILYALARRTGAGDAIIMRLLPVGMGIGLLGVGLVGVWERWLYAGLGNEASTYRIVSTFSSMHTGGGHIEAYLVAAVPFLWFGLYRLRTAIYVIPVLLLTAYVMVFTASRGGVLALGTVALILALGAVRAASSDGRRPAVLGLAALAVLALVFGLSAGSGYLQQRFAQSIQDWGTRVDHWRLGMRIADDSLAGSLFGTGLGTFPRRYLERGPAERQPATFAFVSDPADTERGTYLRLGVGDTLYLAQRIAAADGGRYRMAIEVRAQAPGVRLVVPICEKQLLNSRRCAWTEFAVPSDGAWHTLTQDVDAGDIGKGPWWRHLPVELYFHNPEKSGVIDIDRVRLTAPDGRNLIANGDFSGAGDHWFFKTHSHLPWHLKNVWVHVIFEMGIVGCLLFGLLVIGAGIRLARVAWNGARLAWVLLASLAGLLVVGVFDSLIDAPRIAVLLIAFLFLGVGLKFDSTIGSATSRASA